MDILNIEKRELHQVHLADGRIMRRSTKVDGSPVWVLITGHPDAAYPAWEDLEPEQSMDMEVAFQEAIRPKLPPEAYGMIVPD